MQSYPAVSMVIPTFNRAHVVVEAVRSVLDQTHPGIELIVVDDGSTDETRNVLSEFGHRIRYVYQPNAGPAAARNRGVDLASAGIVTFLDSDDLLAPDAVARQLASPLSRDELRFCKMRFESYGDSHDLLRKVVEHGILWPATDPDSWLIDPLLELGKGRYLQLNGLVCHKAVFETVGPFDEQFRAGEDEEWFYRAALNFRIRLSPDELAVRRIHKNQTGLQREDSLRSLIQVLGRMRDEAAMAGHKEAVRSIGYRLSNLLSSLSNVQVSKGLRREAVGLACRAYFLHPSGLSRAAKVGLLMTGWTPEREPSS